MSGLRWENLGTGVQTFGVSDPSKAALTEGTSMPGVLEATISRNAVARRVLTGQGGAAWYLVDSAAAANQRIWEIRASVEGGITRLSFSTVADDLGSAQKFVEIIPGQGLSLVPRALPTAPVAGTFPLVLDEADGITKIWNGSKWKQLDN